MGTDCTDKLHLIIEGDPVERSFSAQHKIVKDEVSHESKFHGKRVVGLSTVCDLIVLAHMFD
jgi:hypothetical protein